MSDIKPELSKKSKYWISRHRYYELKHHCMQYKEWKRLYNQIEFKMAEHKNWNERSKTSGDPTAYVAQLRADLSRAMETVERCCRVASSELSGYIFKAVTEGRSYDSLKAKDDIPCGREMFYDCYRRFFWLLSKEKGP